MFVVQMIDKLYCFSAVVAEMNTKYSGFPQKLLPHTPGKPSTWSLLVDYLLSLPLSPIALKFSCLKSQGQ